MDDHLLLKLWREVGRHIALAESIAELRHRLAESLPVTDLCVAHVPRARPALETLAVAGDDRVMQGRMTEANLRALFDWCLTGRARLVHPGQPAPWPLEDCVPADDRAGWRFCGPLASELDHRGIALVRLSRKPSEAETQVLERVLAPLAAAMENQLRLTELARLREAAEADRASLLNRLGRDQVGVGDTIVGERAGLRHVMDRVRLVAPANASVLLLGETGTGKEVVARAVHERSDRAAGPFIRVNCGAIPPDLIDTELFGHVKGSFTGAVNSREGWFERADGGTLFLDEIGDLPPAAQVRMLRVLQEGTFHRVGGRDEVRVDVRVVAATHRDLQALVREGRFREDLWYRIAIFPIEIPALRERLDDIPALAAHFARRAARKLGLPAVEPTEADIATLSAYHWPGNVRELAAVMERAAILGEGGALYVDAALGQPVRRSHQPDASAGGEASVLPLESAIARHIEHALAMTHGRVDGPHGAARLLRMNPNTLRSRMRKLGVDAGRFRQRWQASEPPA